MWHLCKRASGQGQQLGTSHIFIQLSGSLRFPALRIVRSSVTSWRALGVVPMSGIVRQLCADWQRWSSHLAWGSGLHNWDLHGNLVHDLNTHSTSPPKLPPPNRCRVLIPGSGVSCGGAGSRLATFGPMRSTCRPHQGTNASVAYPSLHVEDVNWNLTHG